MHKHSTTGSFIGLNSVSNSYFVFTNHPHIPIHATVISKIHGNLWFARRKRFIIAIVGHYCQLASVTDLCAQSSQVNSYGQITAHVLFHQFAIEVNFLLAHDGFEMYQHIFAFGVGRHHKTFAIPRNALIVAASAGFGRHQFHGVRSRHHFPTRIVESSCFCTFHVATKESPAVVEVIHLSPTAFEWVESGYRGGSRKGESNRTEEKEKPPKSPQGGLKDSLILKFH